ncbi:hypothetical protein [Marinomonas piezotolerans]|uniref:hypothetical protein n=1 Tax=Marinomonas piezotolerans TaxID=2213058 RepID=UPI0013143DD6|nr:hypothetical protein [Marinomonas piezotolerans]
MWLAHWHNDVAHYYNKRQQNIQCQFIPDYHGNARSPLSVDMTGQHKYSSMSMVI